MFRNGETSALKVLHAQWVSEPESGPPGGSGGVFVWAETSEAAEPHPRRGRAASVKARPHPFCAPAEELQTLVAPEGRERGERKPTPGKLTLLLPTFPSGPQPSPALLHPWSLKEDVPAELRPWIVAGQWLSGTPALAWLLALPLQGDLAPGVALGADARFWHVAATLALDVLAGQKFLPVLETVPGPKTGEVYRATWQPVLDAPADAGRIAGLEAAMPPLCRASAGNGAADPAALLQSFLYALTDAAVRDWAGVKPARRTWDALPGAVGPWFVALFGPERTVKAPRVQLQALQRGLQKWLQGLRVAGSGDFRVAFRIAPEAEDPPPVEAALTQAVRQPNWTLSYFLQARRDPTLLVPAEAVWQDSPALAELRSAQLQPGRPAEQMLAGLGYAARLFPPIAGSLKARAPSRLAISPADVAVFLRESAPLLEQAGFGVLVPPWWNRPGNRIGVRLRARPKAGAPGAITTSGMGLDRLVEFQWEIAVGDTTLTREEFQALVALKSPVVQLRGQWVQLDPAQVEAALRFWGQQGMTGETSLLGALAMGAAASGVTESGLPLEGVEYEGWLGDLVARLKDRAQLSELPQPAGLAGQLRPYQRYGYSWLAFLRRYGIGPCLADDMGLGKTLQTLALLVLDKEEAQAGPVLLICPTSVVGNWERETRRFAPGLAVHVHQGLDRLRGDAFCATAGGVDLVLTSYPVARRDVDDLAAVAWRGVILDEAQNIKNPQAQQTQAIRRLPAGFRFALTGTPVENRLSELWSIVQFLNPGYLGSYQHFRRDFAIPIERYADPAATERLRQLVSPLILRRVKTDPTVIQDLPEKLEMKVYCNLTEEQASLYQATVEESLAAVASAEGMDRRGQVLAMLLKLKQICNHPALFLHQVDITNQKRATPVELAERSGKLDRLVEMLEEALSAGDRALIFTQFAEMGHALHAYLPQALGRPALFLHGGVPVGQRTEMVSRFQDPSGPPLFILSLKAGGVGLNLTQANHVFHFDRWWNPAVEDQATDRAFRIGQQRNVQVHKFISAGTLEEMIDEMIENKRGLAQAIVGSGEHWLTELSTDELRKLVTLRRV